MQAWRLVATVALLGCLACVSSAAAPTPVGSASPVSAGPEAAAAVDAVRRSAAGQLGVDPAQLSVLQVVPHEWPDRALGCPRPGVMYAQIVTPGYVVVV